MFVATEARDFNKIDQILLMSCRETTKEDLGTEKIINPQVLLHQFQHVQSLVNAKQTRVQNQG
jgi:hypothetical protein